MAIFTEKLLTQLIMPLNAGLALLVLAAMLLWAGRRTWGRRMVVFAILWLWLWSMPVFSHWLRGALEDRYPVHSVEALPHVEAIVVLGGAMTGPQAPTRMYPDLLHAADRVWHAARLYHAGKAPLVVLSGGAMPWVQDPVPEADSMAQFIMDLGVPADALLLERDSLTTYENALRTRELLATRGIDRVLLVTSALHMRRAMGSFRDQGIDAVPAVTDVEIDTIRTRTILDWLPDHAALEGSSRAFKEYLGMIVYRLRGQSN